MGRVAGHAGEKPLEWEVWKVGVGPVGPPERLFIRFSIRVKWAILPSFAEVITGQKCKWDEQRKKWGILLIYSFFFFALLWWLWLKFNWNGKGKIRPWVNSLKSFSIEEWICWWNSFSVVRKKICENASGKYGFIEFSLSISLYPTSNHIESLYVWRLYWNTW